MHPMFSSDRQEVFLENSILVQEVTLPGTFSRDFTQRGTTFESTFRNLRH